jgi:hypothetical protein
MGSQQSPSGGRGDRVVYAELQGLSDERLMQELQAGNPAGCRRAEDLTQTVFLEIYRRLGQFDPARGTLKVWFLQFAYSRSIYRRNYLFVRQVHRQVELSEAEEAESLWSPARLQGLSMCLSSSRSAWSVLGRFPSWGTGGQSFPFSLKNLVENDAGNLRPEWMPVRSTGRDS